MSNIEIYGPDFSTYVMTARLALAEKGVKHTVKPLEFGSSAHAALHPFCRVPIMVDGDFTIAESLAIIQYVDSKGDGPSLIPSDLKTRTTAYKWVGHVMSDIYSRIVPGYILKYVLPKLAGNAPDQSEIEAGVPELKRALELLETNVGDDGWFAGTALSIADLYIAPLVIQVGNFPEAAAILETMPNLKRFANAIERRDSWKAIRPQVA